MDIILTVIVVALIYRWLKNPSAGLGRNQYLREAINDLEVLTDNHPKLTAKDLLTQYRKELGVVIQSRTKTAMSSRTEPHADQGFSFGRWYELNSINLLLYVGAFLIVASASIFVGFQWESIGGVAKAIFITAISLAFLVGGVVFYRIPKIRTAGMVFSSLGGLLIPFCGLAYYNFILKDLGVAPGPVWLLTSALTLTVFVILALRMEKMFYSYMSLTALLSLSLSMVSVYGANSRFYILAGIISAYVMLLIRRYLSQHLSDNESLVMKPLQVYADLTIAASLGFGLIMAVSDDALYSLEASISVFLGAVYFLISYLTYRRLWQYALAVILLPVSASLFFSWQQVPEVAHLYYLAAIGGLYAVVAGAYVRAESRREAMITAVVSTMLLVGLLLVSLVSDHSSLQNLIMALGLSVVSGYFVFRLNSQAFFVPANIGLTAAGFIWTREMLTMGTDSELTAIAMLMVSVAWYAAAISGYLDDLKGRWALGSSAWFMLLALIIAQSRPEYAAVASLILAGLLLHAAWKYGTSSLVYGSNLAIFMAVLYGIRWYGIQPELHPLMLSATAAALYAYSLVARPEWRREYRLSALIGAAVVPAVFKFAADNSVYTTTAAYHAQEQNALLSAYAAIGLVAYDAVEHHSERGGYIASAMAMLTYLWHASFVGTTETLVYTLPLAAYFLVLGYLRRLKQDVRLADIFDGIGLFMTVIPTFILTFDHGYTYALALGAMGVLLLVIGISMNYRWYRYAGVAAIVLSVISQTYEYLFSLPRWLITGLAGLIFLVCAIFLMLRRQEKDHS